jgi:putative addiction module component (TIGR02574 family)
MSDFDTVLSDARKLSEAERLRLIDALWEDVSDDAELPLHQDWAAELERRVAALQAGTAKTTPWETVRAEALARIGHGSSH